MGIGGKLSMMSSICRISIYYILLLTMAIASGCRKNKDDENSRSSPVIYVVGYEYNDSAGRTSIAKIWENGISTNLTDGKSFAQPTSVFVSGNDIYVVGSEIKAGINVARLWKNGVATNLTDGSHDAAARSVFVAGTDVYVLGIENDGRKFVPKVWKNEVPTELRHGSGNVDVSSIFVKNADIYAAGAEFNGDPATNGAKLWKNGIDTILSKVGKLSGVILLDNDIVTTGYYGGNVDRSTAAVWKNGILGSIQTDLYYSSYASSLHAVNNNIYISGSGINFSGTSVAVVWKNGIPINLSDGMNYAIAMSVYADSSSYYAVGYEYINGQHVAKLWTNGVNNNLTDGKGKSYAMSVFVK